MLDDRSFLTTHDPDGMLGLSEAFPDQVREALSIARQAALPTWAAKPDSVVLTGMGGSAAGGDFVKAIFDAEATVPFVVNRDYVLPNWVGAGTLVFVASYSGETEETLAAYHQARRKGANMIVVTSGGQIGALAKQDGFPVIQIPGGQPPRTALGYLLMPVLVACEQLKLIRPLDDAGIVSHLEQIRAAHGPDQPEVHNASKQLARKLLHRVICLYGLGSWQASVANRWKGQINENAKHMAFSNAQPELCHNEIVGWEGALAQADRWAVVSLEDGTESAKMQKRRLVTAELTQGATQTHTVLASGSTLLNQMLGLAYEADWVSLYLAALAGHDPKAIKPIDHLKAELGKIS